MPVLIVSRQRRQGKALERALVRHGLLAMLADGPADALGVANVLRFKVAVFLDPIDEQAAAAMHELHARHGIRGIAVDAQPLDEASAAEFVRRLDSPATPESLLQSISEVRAAV